MEWGVLWWVAWAIPAVLVFLVAVFVALAPVLVLAGVIMRVFQVVSDRLPTRAQTEPGLR